MTAGAPSLQHAHLLAFARVSWRSPSIRNRDCWRGIFGKRRPSIVTVSSDKDENDHSDEDNNLKSYEQLGTTLDCLVPSTWLHDVVVNRAVESPASICPDRFQWTDSLVVSGVEFAAPATASTQYRRILKRLRERPSASALVPLNITNSHWVLLVFSRSLKQVSIYDSLSPASGAGKNNPEQS